LGLYRISKEPNQVPHLAILLVKSDLFNKDCKDIQLAHKRCGLENNGASSSWHAPTLIPTFLKANIWFQHQPRFC